MNHVSVKTNGWANLKILGAAYDGTIGIVLLQELGDDRSAIRVALECDEVASIMHAISAGVTREPLTLCPLDPIDTTDYALDEVTFVVVTTGLDKSRDRLDALCCVRGLVYRMFIAQALALSAVTRAPILMDWDEYRAAAYALEELSPNDGTQFKTNEGLGGAPPRVLH